MYINVLKMPKVTIKFNPLIVGPSIMLNASTHKQVGMGEKQEALERSKFGRVTVILGNVPILPSSM